MRKNQYYQHKKHYPYFSLYWAESSAPCIYIIASKKGVHQNATKRNFAKRRLRACLRDFLTSTKESMPSITLKIVAKKEVLTCSFSELNLMLNQSLKALLS